MRKVRWELRIASPPAALRKCGRCGVETAFTSSGKFRVNAQGRRLDVWLVYRCPNCDGTWNARVASRVTPEALGRRLGDFVNNSPDLAARYACDPDFIRQNGAEPAPPEFQIVGPVFDPEETVELTITSACPLSVRVSPIVRDKLGLSRARFDSLTDSGLIRSDPPRDLKKMTLGREAVLLFGPLPAREPSSGTGVG